MFTCFYRACIHGDAQFALSGLTHRASQLFPDGLFDGQENAIVDFKYSSSPRLTWWFDHHQSAFLTPSDAEHFRGDNSGKKFYDPSYKSCTKLLADLARDRFGFDPRPLAELIHWGDVIDGAQFPTPESAVKLDSPALQLALVIEAVPGMSLSSRLIPDLATRSLADVIRLPLVAEHLPMLLARHERSVAVLQQRAESRDGVVFFDVSADELEGYNKFIPYYLFPEARYSVGVSASATRAKVSVGSNPWREDAGEHNLASLCERYGGGGHPRVAAISFEPGQLDRARTAAREIAAALRG